MSDMGRLKALLESGTLLHPVSDALSIVDFANALHDVMGVPNVSLNENASAVKGLIGEPEHLVLVMADGFGMNFVEGLDSDAFIPNHIAAEMRTVFPSTTPIALTALATGEWPGAHGVIGWFVMLTEIAAVSTIISYVRTCDNKPLSELGVRVEDTYPVPSQNWRCQAGLASYIAGADCRQRLFQLLDGWSFAGGIRCEITAAGCQNGT